MRKILILGLTTILTLGFLGGNLAPSAYASENTSFKVRESVVPTENLVNKDVPESVLEVAPYVHKNEQGLFYVDENIPTDIYIKNNVEDLEKHLEEINAQVTSGEVTINDDLSITSNMMTPYASKGYTSEKRWWGEIATYTNAQANKAVRDTAVAAAQFGFGALGLYAIPLLGVLAAPVGITGGYLTLLAAKMDAANKGRGVILNMTWAFAFTVKSR